MSRPQEQREPDEKIKYIELSVNTVAFISCRCRLTKVLAGATMGETGNKDGGSHVRLPDVDTGRLSGLKYSWYNVPNRWQTCLPISTSDNLTRPPPPLLPFSPLAAPANTLVSLHLQLMNATVWLKVPYISSFHWALSALVMSTDGSQVNVTLFPSF